MLAKVRRFAATLAGALVFHSYLYRWFLRRRAVIVLFHRVDDRYPLDPLTRTQADFERFLAFFARFFRVVTLGELARRIERGESVARHLVITFDDGYLDNQTTAAVALARAGLPACFFITTEFIGSDRVPWWDADAGIRSEWMAWDHVRALHQAGFEIGAHTCNHVDLGVVSGHEAQVEIEGSKERLEAELGAPVRCFSYPYGRRENFTPDNKLLVRDAGFEVCVSAFGGMVAPGADRLALPRIAISQWFQSPYQFGLDAIRTR
jgi:peptidoglycan/xylan/chitin deacetylase (PgdA/CDA1 family)